MADGKILITFNSASTYPSGLTMDKENIRMTDATARWEGTKTVTVASFGEGQNLNDYNYLNMWVKSGVKNNTSLNLIIYDGPQANNIYFRYVLTIDWEGWKMVSIPLSSFSTDKDASWDNVTAFYINATGWGNTNYSENTRLYFEQIWYSKSAPGSFEYIGVDVPSGAENQSVIGTRHFVFSNVLADGPEGAVKVTDSEGQEIGGYTAEKYANDLSVTFDTPLTAVSYTHLYRRFKA